MENALRNGEELRHQLSGLIQEGSLGLDIGPPRPDGDGGRGRWLILSPRPFLAGIQMTVGYFLLFGAIPYVMLRTSGELPPYLWPLLALQLYGALWSGWAAASTRLASRSVMNIIEAEVLPALSPRAVDAVSREIARRHTDARARWASFFLSWALGGGAAAIAGMLLYFDLPERFRPPVGWMVFWSLGWWVLYTTAAKVVMVSRFYEAFAIALAPDEAAGGRDEPLLFWPNAAGSSLVAGIAQVAKRMLLFWLLLAISIALILPFGGYVGEMIKLEYVDRWDAPLAGALKLGAVEGVNFVIAHLVGTALFSIGVGSLIFLRNEARLRRAARATTAMALRVIEREAGSLAGRNSLAKGEAKRIAELRTLHAEVAGGAPHRTFLLSGLSLIIPFVPLLSLLLNLLA